MAFHCFALLKLLVVSGRYLYALENVASHRPSRTADKYRNINALVWYVLVLELRMKLEITMICQCTSLRSPVEKRRD